jgi:hypothetical protein
MPTPALHEAPRASPTVTFGIALIALVVFAVVVLAAWRTSRRDGLVVGSIGAGWLALSGALAGSGFLAHDVGLPPRMLALLVPLVGLPVLLAFSPIGGRMARGTPLAWLVGFHAFRLPLELVMHQAALEGTMPEQMSFQGWNFDIATGVSAVLLAALVGVRRAPRALVLAWNALGGALLVIVMVIAVASLPRFAAFGTEPARLNTWVMHLPFVWLPAVLVASALAGHLIIARALLRSPDAERSGPAE